jgi:hypothetical protein
MDEGDGVYYSETARRPRHRRAVAGIAALAAVLGAGAYVLTTVIVDRNRTATTAEPGVLAPFGTPSPSPSRTPSAEAPSPGPVAGTRAAVRQSTRPSPTPSPGATPDDEIADAQVSRLLQARPTAAASGVAAASGPVTVANEAGADGSTIRVVSARYDLTGRWELLLAADRGRQVGDGRCTNTFKVGGTAEVRPTMLLCWRTTAPKSVVTVATVERGTPSPPVSIAAIARAWSALG